MTLIKDIINQNKRLTKISKIISELSRHKTTKMDTTRWQAKAFGNCCPELTANAPTTTPQIHNPNTQPRLHTASLHTTNTQPNTILNSNTTYTHAQHTQTHYTHTNRELSLIHI